ncbi:uncharacterized protein Tco025E_00779, partial [Trypanosoma conorhini]
KEPSAGKEQAREYPREEQHALKEPSAGKKPEREYPGEEQHALREPSAGKEQAQEYPREEQHALKGPSENLRGAAVGHQGGEGEAVQSAYPVEKEAESNLLGESSQGQPREMEQKPGGDCNVEGLPEAERTAAETAGNRPQEGAAGQNVAAKTKPPRAVRAIVPEERTKNPSGTSPFMGVPPVSPIRQSLSSPQSERGQGDTVAKRRGVTPLGDDNITQSQQLPLPKVTAVRQPWFPAGSSLTEDHIPLDKRESFMNRADSIKDLERRSRESGRSSGRHASRHATPHE